VIAIDYYSGRNYPGMTLLFIETFVQHMEIKQDMALAKSLIHIAYMRNFPVNHRHLFATFERCFV
jgi:hypothetical protein